MLIIRIDCEKNKENYQKVMAALADFDIASAAWESVESTPQSEAKSGRSGDDLSSAVSDIVNRMARGNGGR